MCVCVCVRIFLMRLTKLKNLFPEYHIEHFYVEQFDKLPSALILFLKALNIETLLYNFSIKHNYYIF